MQVSRNSSELLDVVTLSHGGVDEHYISSRTGDGDNLAVFRGVPPVDATVLSQFVFGGEKFHGEAVALMGGADWPITWLHGDGCSGENLAGAQALAISGTDVRRVTLDGRVVGSAYADADADYCYLGGVLPADLARSRPEQARSVFERLEAALATVGMNFHNVARTWLYNENILAWYGDFNQVRTAFFNERKVFDHLIPASTGIGASNPAGAALVAGLIAIRPKHAGVRIFAVPSPLQCPATAYRSSFSRAVEVQYPDRRHLYISGSASIEPGGKTIYVGDVDKQIAFTMVVAEAILGSRGMHWADTTRMIAYFKDMKDAPRFGAYCRERGLAPLPAVLSHTAICRDDLLFEIELDAVSASAAPKLPD